MCLKRLNRLVRETKPDPDGAGAVIRPITLYTYDAVGNLLTITDPVGNATTYSYDEVGNLLTDTNEHGNTRSYTYDLLGRRTEMNDRNGRETEYTYDSLGRLVTEEWLDASSTVIHTIDYTFDPSSRPTSVSDDNATYTYSYNGKGMLASVSNQGTPGVPEVLIEYTYGGTGRLDKAEATVDGDADFVNDYSYDQLNRLTSIEQSAGGGVISVADKRVDFEYNLLGQTTLIDRYADLTATTLAAATALVYDDRHRLSSVDHTDGSNTIVAYSWTHDALNRVTSMTSVDGTESYTYDPTGQLIDVDASYRTDEAYSYDENGNRTMAGYSTGVNNELSTDGNFSYTYDDEGNRTSKTDLTTGEVVEYDWDHRNRLVGITFKDGQGSVFKTITYRYDANNRRVASIVDQDGPGAQAASELHFVYDGDDIVLTYDENGDMVDRYLHGPAIDTILASEDTSGDVLYALTDNLGTVRDLVDDTGTHVEHRTYDAFGNILSDNNPAIDFLFSYTGREWDPDAQLQYNRTRWYDASTGRWLNQDPIAFDAGDTNLYRYVGNDPATKVDPSGLVNDNPWPWWSPMGLAHDIYSALNPSGEGIGPAAMGAARDGNAEPARKRMNEIRQESLDSGLIADGFHDGCETARKGLEAAEKAGEYADKALIVKGAAKELVKKGLKEGSKLLAKEFARDQAQEVMANAASNAAQAAGVPEGVINAAGAVGLPGKKSKGKGNGSNSSNKNGTKSDRSPSLEKAKRDAERQMREEDVFLDDHDTEFYGGGNQTTGSVAPKTATASRSAKRLQYLGRTPGKGSRSGREVQERMF